MGALDMAPRDMSVAWLSKVVYATYAGAPSQQESRKLAGRVLGGALLVPPQRRFAREDLDKVLANVARHTGKPGGISVAKDWLNKIWSRRYFAGWAVRQTVQVWEHSGASVPTAALSSHRRSGR